MVRAFIFIARKLAISSLLVVYSHRIAVMLQAYHAHHIVRVIISSGP